MTDYGKIALQIKALTEGVPYAAANLSNSAAVIYSGVEDVSWAGFYMLEDGALILGPFQGPPACIRIEPGKGVCGTAFEKAQTLIVPDVHEFPGHIACDPASASEAVVPLRTGSGAVKGVLDIDSRTAGRFSEEDRAGLEMIARAVGEFLSD